MKIHVHDILPTQPKVLHFVGKEPFLQEILGNLVADEAKLALPVVNEIRADVEVSRDGNTVFVNGDAHATLHIPCARCLKAVTVNLDPAIALSLLPAASDDDEGADQLGDEEIEEYTYSNEEVDVGLILNEQLLLEKPVKVLCAEDCPGLCPSCGQDLNEGPCACAPQPKSLAFAALKNFKPRN